MNTERTNKMLLWHCWLGDRKGIRPGNNLASAIYNGS